MESNTADKNELEEERSEDIVVRIREHVESAERKKSSDPRSASSHTATANDLLNRLWKRHCKRAKAIARSVFGPDRELLEDVEVEVARQLHRVIMQPDGTLRGLDEKFGNAFRSICIDAIRDVGRETRGRLGSSVPNFIRETPESPLQETKREKVVPADIPTRDKRDRDIPPVETGMADVNSEEDFKTILGHLAYKALAQRLPERQRKVIEMVSQEKTFKQIALELGHHPDTISDDFQKAIRFFENNLAAELKVGR